METKAPTKRGAKHKPVPLRRSAVSVMFNNADIKAIGGREALRLFCQDKVAAEAQNRRLNETNLKTRKKPKS